ncbi:MAG: hypothetical protein WBK76_05215 [Candidatus Saccharimonadales bacterium]
MIKERTGFTIIELTLAMSFVSLLLIAIATLSIQLTNQYTRGLTLNEVSQAGTEASNDMRRAVSQARVQDGGGVRTKSVSGHSVLCTGSYSYVASNPDSLEAGNGIKIRNGSGSVIQARLTKVNDAGGTLCAPTGTVLETGAEYDSSDVVELLSGGSRLLAVRSFEVSPTPAEIAQPSHPYYAEFQKGRGIYTIKMTIAAGLRSEQDLVAGNCKPPSDVDANLNFCAVDTFEFTARVGGSSRQ